MRYDIITVITSVAVSYTHLQTWEALFEKTAARVKQYGEFRGTLAGSADALYRCLRFDDEISLDSERLYVYARMRSDEDKMCIRDRVRDRKDDLEFTENSHFF